MAPPEILERDGFEITKEVFINPSNTTLLASATRRKITICNLFVNHRLSLRDILRVLDEKYDHVVCMLIEQGLVLERRKNPRKVGVDRRHRRRHQELIATFN
jgi:hypothetical protein